MREVVGVRGKLGLMKKFTYKEFLKIIALSAVNSNYSNSMFKDRLIGSWLQNCLHWKYNFPMSSVCLS